MIRTIKHAIRVARATRAVEAAELAYLSALRPIYGPAARYAMSDARGRATYRLNDLFGQCRKARAELARLQGAC